MLGVNEMLAAPRDGYTVMVHLNGAVSEIPHISKPRFDPIKDIKPLAELARSGLLFVGAPQLQARTLKDVIAYAKANPGKVNFASYSAGTVSHTLGVQLNAQAGLDMQHVGYEGLAPGTAGRHGWSCAADVRRPRDLGAHGQGRQGEGLRSHLDRSACRLCPTCRPSPNRASPP